MSEEVVEQITRDPPKESETADNSSKKRTKNPKKVAAGKKLAEYNKKAKEALARETQRAEEQMKREEKMKQEEETNEDGESKAWLPELSFTTVLSIIGIGFTAFDMFMRYRQNREPTQTLSRPTVPYGTRMYHPSNSQACHMALHIAVNSSQ